MVGNSKLFELKMYWIHSICALTVASACRLKHGDRDGGGVTGKAKRRDRATESRKTNGMGAADERLQGTGRGDCEV